MNGSLDDLDVLCRRLAELAPALDASGSWPSEQLRLCAESGVFRWFLPAEYGGWAWSEKEIVGAYVRIAEACLTTAFVLTQRAGACRHIVESENEPLKRRLLSDLASGRTFATVGISHLTTSRRHFARPVLSALPTEEGYRLEGLSPWVTGADHAETVVLGGTLDDGRQILVALPMGSAGVTVPPAIRLMALSASHTGEIHMAGVELGNEVLIAGPAENILQQGASRARTGGQQTSALALGVTTAAVRFLEQESMARTALRAAAVELRRERDEIELALLAAADGHAVCSNEDLRARANSLVLRSSQAAMAAAKGAGYTAGHPANRWCREALFFLVWSCPQPVLDANLCELANLEG